jgi:hypothetical protein
MGGKRFLPDDVVLWEVGGVGSRGGNIFVGIIFFIGLAYNYQGKDIVFRFILEYSSIMDFGP